MPSISVLTSLYRAAPYIEDFYARGKAAVEKITEDYEFVFVDDGSPDDGNAIVFRLMERDPRVRLVELSRNFGQHRALVAGLDHVRGDLVFMIDADLEEDPELITEFHRVMQESGTSVDVVYGVMERRKGGLFERVSGALFYKLINTVAEVPIPANVLGARLMTQQYVQALRSLGDAEPFLGALMAYTGFTQVPVPCRKTSKGSTTYSLRRKLRLAADALFSLSRKPLTWIFTTGVAASAIGLILLVYGLSTKPLDAFLDNAPAVLASVWLLAGLILMALGILGQYVGRIHMQVKDRPVAIVKQVHERGPGTKSPGT